MVAKIIFLLWKSLWYFQSPWEVSFCFSEPFVSDFSLKWSCIFFLAGNLLWVALIDVFWVVRFLYLTLRFFLKVEVKKCCLWIIINISDTVLSDTVTIFESCLLSYNLWSGKKDIASVFIFFQASNKDVRISFLL